MPGHIWLLLGDYELTADVNENAAERDREYMQTTGVSASAYAGYYIHNLHFVAYARSMEGRKADAIRAAETISEAIMPFIKQMPAMVDAFVPIPIFAFLRFQQWDQILALKAPDSVLPASTAVWHFGRAIALAAKGNRQEALGEKEEFQKAIQKVTEDQLWLNNKTVNVLKIASAMLEARLAGNDQAAIPIWKQTVSHEDALSYDEPPAWFFPVRESLGGALLRSGQAEQAEVVFREGLRRRPRNGRMLFGLMKCLEAQKKIHAAELVRREYETAWKHADITLRVEDL
jgi:tetratricopeptide (TPR) repeat protein